MHLDSLRVYSQRTISSSSPSSSSAILLKPASRLQASPTDHLAHIECLLLHILKYLASYITHCSTTKGPVFPKSVVVSTGPASAYQVIASSVQLKSEDESVTSQSLSHQKYLPCNGSRAHPASSVHILERSIALLMIHFPRRPSTLDKYRYPVHQETLGL